MVAAQGPGVLGTRCGSGTAGQAAQAREGDDDVTPLFGEGRAGGVGDDCSDPVLTWAWLQQWLEAQPLAKN